MSPVAIAAPMIGIEWPTDRSVTEYVNLDEAQKAEDDTSVTFGLLRFEAQHALRETVRESSRENWDGYGARALDAGAVAVAVRVLELVLSYAPLPDVGADTDGDILLEWQPTDEQVYSVSVAKNGVLAYAGIFGSDSKTHGTELFRDEIPASIREDLRRLFP